MANISKYKDQINNGTVVLKGYSQLSDTSKVKAREEILDCELSAYNKDLTNFRMYIINNIHSIVNDENKLPSFIRRKNHINKLTKDLNHIENLIIGNLCNFLEDGTYITYLN